MNYSPTFFMFLFVSRSGFALVAANEQFCSTDACTLAGQRMSAAINTSADPCEDFFEYACGNWIATHPISDNATEASSIDNLRKNMKLVLQDVLGVDRAEMFPSEIKAKSIYKQCQNQDEIEKLGAKPVLDFLTEQIGGWPVLNPNWNASNFDLFTALVKLRLYKSEAFFAVDVEQDLLVSADNIIHIEETASFATRDVLESERGDSVTESYLTLLTNVTGLIMREIGDQRDVTAVAGELTDLLDLGRFISLSGQTAVEKRDFSALKNKTTLGANQAATFTRSAFFRNMTGYLRAVFEPVGLSHLINPQTPIVLRAASFFDRLDEKFLELERLNDTGKRRLANYIGWRVIVSSILQLPKKYRDEWAEQLRRIQGQVTRRETPTKERCATEVLSAMPWAVDAMYIRDYVPKDLKTKASIMVADMKAAFRGLLGEATWMDNETSAAALQKLDSMLTFIAYPLILSDNISYVDKLYENVTVGGAYFETRLELAKTSTFKNLKLLVTKNIRGDLTQDTPDIMGTNAFYRPEHNIIIVLAGILQYPFFVAGNPEYINYGSNGFAISHEITHGFDDQGSSFDDVGLMRSWWTNASKEAYNQKKKTIVDQYNAFALSSGHVNGELTLGENIADNGGLKTAYRAYFDHFRKRQTEPELLLSILPTATPEQLFFLSAAQVWCGKRRPAAERLSILTNVHSPYKFRVIGPMSNMPEFSRAFNCSIGSKMNPTVKASVW
ncbi:Endothelin-converting enzyme 1 [Hypsibius exemplaris]|uniref:Endothelin-converting enzyme 1 n=1 Tax=Hypsibius exemplaris TaxID=2072580 RepID=A0A9X6RK68_HYPEX|nr:Endothelin-converting enzyme 1 [Hypsibius exemplaris]